MLEVENLHKMFSARSDRVRAADNVSFSVAKGRLLTLLGPSGCGKTTILRSIAGLEHPDSGRVVIGDVTVFDSARRVALPSARRGIGMMFQSYAIWPHMSVFENIAFPLRVSRGQRYSRSEIAAKVKRAMELVRLEGYESRATTQLSGGQQQRLALARALVHEPKLLLLDEPISNLDAKLREQMRFELKRLQQDLGLTMLFVTHDQTEALALSDEIAVINAGRILQRGAPQEIYRRPKSRFVADFLGSSNFVTATVETIAGSDGIGAVRTPQGVLRCSFTSAVRVGQPVSVTMRAEDIALVEHGGAFANAKISGLEGGIVSRVFLGDALEYLVRIGEQEIRIRARPDSEFAPYQKVLVGFAADKCVALPDQEAPAPAAA